jgi:predicted RND superfamily exporter protein
MKKIFKEFGVHFCAATILLGISLLFNDCDVADEEQLSLLVVVLCGVLISIGGYNYLKNRKGVVVMIVGVIVLGVALSTLSF